MVVVTFAGVPMAMLIVGVTQDGGADDIDDQAKGCHHHGFHIVDGLGRKDPFDGSEHHERCNPKQENRAGESSQNLDFPGAERESRIAGIAPRSSVGKGGQADRQCVGTHVPAIGEQRHGVKP